MTWRGTMKNTSCILEEIPMPKLRAPINTKNCFPLLVYEGDIQSCSRISQLAKASPKKSTAMFSLTNWTTWVCERKQKHLEEKYEPCHSAFFPKSPWLTYNLPESWSSRHCNSTGYHTVRSANCFTSSNCWLLLCLHYLSPFTWFLVMFPISAIWKAVGIVAVSHTFKSQGNWAVIDNGWLAGGKSFFLYANLTSNRQPF